MQVNALYVHAAAMPDVPRCIANVVTMIRQQMPTFGQIPPCLLQKQDIATAQTMTVTTMTADICGLRSGPRDT